MKRVITSASSYSSPYTKYNSYQRGRQKYSVHFNEPENPIDFKAQITEIHPYDDADYVWARIGAKGAMEVEFVQNYKVIDRMQMHYYDDEDYENVDEYYDEIIDRVCIELSYFNKDVEPRMIHN